MVIVDNLCDFVHVPQNYSLEFSTQSNKSQSQKCQLNKEIYKSKKQITQVCSAKFTKLRYNNIVNNNNIVIYFTKYCKLKNKSFGRVKNNFLK